MKELGGTLRYLLFLAFLLLAIKVGQDGWDGLGLAIGRFLAAIREGMGA